MSSYEQLDIRDFAKEKHKNYDVIVCDIGLPGMDGFEVVKQLRLQSLKPEPYFIAASGYNQTEDRIRAIEAGFDHYLVKPIDTDILVALISSNSDQ